MEGNNRKEIHIGYIFYNKEQLAHPRQLIYLNINTQMKGVEKLK